MYCPRAQIEEFTQQDQCTQPVSLTEEYLQDNRQLIRSMMLCWPGIQVHLKSSKLLCEESRVLVNIDTLALFVLYQSWELSQHHLNSEVPTLP